MKKTKKNIIFAIWIILPFIVSGVFLSVLPEQIPTNFLAVELEWKSKYSILKSAILVALMEIIYYFYYIWRAEKITKKAGGKSDLERDEAVLKNAESHYKTILLFMFAIVNIIYFITLFLTWKLVNGAELKLADISAVILSAGMSVCLIVLGNVMPRMHENKEPFSRKWKNIKPQTQRKINQVSGWGLMLCGLLSFILTLLIHNIYTIMITFGLTFITAVFMCIYSYIIYSKEEK